MLMGSTLLLRDGCVILYPILFLSLIVICCIQRPVLGSLKLVLLWVRKALCMNMLYFLKIIARTIIIFFAPKGGIIRGKATIHGGGIISNFAHWKSWDRALNLLFYYPRKFKKLSHQNLINWTWANFLSVPNLVPWLIFSVNMLGIRSLKKSSLISFAGSDSTSTWQGGDKRKRRWRDRWGWQLFSIFPSKGGNYSREVINQGTAIIRGNKVWQSKTAQLRKTLVCQFMEMIGDNRELSSPKNKWEVIGKHILIMVNWWAERGGVKYEYPHLMWSVLTTRPLLLPRNME